MACTHIKLDPDELVLIAPVIALSLAKGRTSEDIEILAAFMTSVADLLSLLALRTQPEPDLPKAPAPKGNTTA